MWGFLKRCVTPRPSQDLRPSGQVRLRAFRFYDETGDRRAQQSAPPQIILMRQPGVEPGAVCIPCARDIDHAARADPRDPPVSLSPRRLGA